MTSPKVTEAIDWLFGAQAFGIKLGLENIQRLLSALDLPVENCPILHVAGSNGKGSTCALAESVLRHSGLRTGLFTSPHLIRFHERARVSGVEMTDEVVFQKIIKIRDLVASWDPHPTFFEMTLAIALDHFRDEGCEVIILETGMGGRLDATNAFTPAACAITPIALDHQKWLGANLAEIAAEKAGIFKPGVPVVAAPQSAEVETVLREQAKKTACPLNILNRDAIGIAHPLGLAGRHQQENAQLALALLEAAELLPANEALITEGLLAARWPARFDRRNFAGTNNTLVIDGAHNPHAAQALVNTWREEYGDTQVPIVFASVEDKDTTTVLEILTPIAGQFIFTKTTSPRALEPEALASLSEHPSVLIDAPEQAMAAAFEESPLALLTGSLFLAGQALAIIEGQAQQISSQ